MGVPIIEELVVEWGCRKGDLPTTYVGLPLCDHILLYCARAKVLSNLVFSLFRIS